MKKRIKFLLAATIIFVSVFMVTRPADSVFAAFKAKVNTNLLNVREKPSVSSTNVGQLKKGKVVTISQEKDGWSKILFGKSYGWVSSKYLTKNLVVESSIKEGYVTATSLNLRTSASISSTKVATLSKGTLVNIKSSKSNWLQVYVPSSNTTGWVSQSYISDKNPITTDKNLITSPAIQGTIYFVTTNGLNIRSEPTTAAEVLQTAEKNEELIVSEKKGNWGKVTTASGVTGWASLSYLTTVKVLSTNGLENKVIVIDAGHGGKDPGSSGEIYSEKTLTLNTAKELEALLKAAGAKVIMTRAGDTYPTLSDRVNISRNNNADIFISIHFNSNNSKAASGIDTYYYGTNVNEKELANCIQEEVIKATGFKSRGVNEGDFQVIRTNKMAAVLVELGFISNPDEEKIIATKEYQVKAATGIVNGLEKYFNR